MYASHYQAPRIQEVLRLKHALGPAGAHLEFNAEKVPDFAEHAVSDLSQKVPFVMRDRDKSLQRDRNVRLHAGATERNVLQVANQSPGATRLVFPADVYQICT